MRVYSLPLCWLTVLMPPPSPVWIDNRAGRANIAEGMQRIVDHAALLNALTRLAIRVAKGPSEVNRTRRPNFLGDLAQPDDADSGNPSRLNRTCDQSNGLVADSSGWAEQHRIDSLLPQLRCNLGRALL